MVILLSAHLHNSKLAGIAGSILYFNVYVSLIRQNVFLYPSRGQCALAGLVK